MIGNQSEDTSGKGEGRAPKFSVTKIGEWETITNERGGLDQLLQPILADDIGLMAISSTH